MRGVPVVLVSLLVCLPGVVSCKKLLRASRGDGGAAATAPVALSETYTSKNGMLRVHYPPEFAAKSTEHGGVVLARNLSFGEDEAMSFVAIGEPISNELDEFARVVLNAEVSHLEGYAETKKEKTTCLGEPCIERTGTTSISGRPYAHWACAFLHGGHGYAFTYAVPQHSLADEAPTFRRIVDATELLPAP